MANRLSGKRILITGAAQGIGLAIAEASLKEGASLCLVDKDGAQLKKSVKALGDHPDRVIWCEADITDEQSIKDALATADGQFGRINALVNNAGVNVHHEPLETETDEWNRCFDVNVKGAWNCCKAVLPGMIELGGGVILNIASTHSFTIIKNTFPYPVAKHALLGLTKSLGLEYAEKGIRVNALAPGYVETQINIDYWNSFPDPAKAKAETLALHPGGKVASPQEIALAAVFLVSDECPFINAACLMADGGLSVQQHPV